MKEITLKQHPLFYEIAILGSANVRDEIGRIDIRKIAYELAREMLANGCLLDMGAYRALEADEYRYRVYVIYGKKEGKLP